MSKSKKQPVTSPETLAKCEQIVRRILGICNEQTDKSCGVAFSPDWGGNSLTVEISGLGHTHCGDPDNSFADLVDSLHSTLHGGHGLSFARDDDGDNA